MKKAAALALACAMALIMASALAESEAYINIDNIVYESVEYEITAEDGALIYYRAIEYPIFHDDTTLGKHCKLITESIVESNRVDTEAFRQYDFSGYESLPQFTILVYKVHSIANGQITYRVDIAEMLDSIRPYYITVDYVYDISTGECVDFYEYYEYEY